MDPIGHPVCSVELGDPVRDPGREASVRAKRVKRMSAAPKKMVRTQAKKAGRLAPWVSGPGPILFGVAAVACFAVAVALNLASDSPRKPDAAIAVVAADAKTPAPQKPRAKAERL